MRWLFLIGTVVMGIWSAWLLLLAYRFIGKPGGQDPRYDAWMEYWSGTFKVMAVIGILTFVLEVVGLALEKW